MMATEPAWKRLGLKINENRENTSFSSVVHLESANVDKQLAKKLNKKRHREEENKKKNSKEKKPPKRAKVPKSERKPPPEKDQLAYLRQYATDKENWKFSKQKQNWILKNLDSIPNEYEGNLISYIEGIQGGARDRLVEQLTEVANQWNEVCKAIEDKVNAELYGDGKTDAENEDSEKKEEEDKKEGPQVTREHAIRTKKLLHALTDEPVEFLGLTEEEESESTEAQKGTQESETKENKEEDKDEEKAEDNSEEAQKESSEGKDAPNPESDDEKSEEKGDQPEDNLIIERVDVEDYFEDSDPEPPKKSKSSSKSKSKSSKSKSKSSKHRKASDASK
ncbi:hypothetical protein FT663_04689 [Candidozyma haemuli var. vulneris]|nr:hypothetical protein FT662_04879 [[Candida] haemuloni var. vulneris]KAF3986877.1 hypothetical protein FT663_04689 [[Candida] haemuloni var. vulneris]